MSNESFAAEFRKTFESIPLPDEISERFHITCRLGDFGETFLMSEKSGKDLYVLKKCRKPDLQTESEADILRGIEHEGLPVYENPIECGDEIFVVRKYIEGETLAEFMAEEHAIGVVIDVMLKICDVLQFLHSRSAPIIHRDIKPSNIIVNPVENCVTLIDFGISRKFSKDARTDTVHFGTHDFAPPEQYGFAQTDNRSDIYSLGVVLRFWITGTTDRDAEIGDKALARIVAKCTALAPEMRFQNAAALKKSLLKYKNRAHTRIFAGAACLLAVCTMLIFWAIASHTPPGDALEVELAALCYVDWCVTRSEIIRITGDGRYTARLEFDGEYAGFPLIGLYAPNMNLNSPVDQMADAMPPPERFRNAEIFFDEVIINDSLSLGVDNDRYIYNYIVSRAVGQDVEGYAFMSLWNAWFDGSKLLMGVETAVVDAYNPGVYKFTVPGVSAIKSIEVVFTITGVEG